MYHLNPETNYRRYKNTPHLQGHLGNFTRKAQARLKDRITGQSDGDDGQHPHERPHLRSEEEEGEQNVPEDISA